MRTLVLFIILLIVCFVRFNMVGETNPEKKEHQCTCCGEVISCDCCETIETTEPTYKDCIDEPPEPTEPEETEPEVIEPSEPEETEPEATEPSEPIETEPEPSEPEETTPPYEGPHSSWYDVKYFDKSEFECHCGGVYCNGFPVEPELELVKLCDKVREHFGSPMVISSGVRCPQHNANVGGAKASRHMYGKAVDFRIAGYTSYEVLQYVQTLSEVRYSYAVDENYVHMDIY